MLKRLLSLASIFLLLHASNEISFRAFAQATQGDARVEKVKAGVAKRVKKRSRVTVKLEDGTKLKGNITEAGEESFTLTDAKTGQTRTLAYRDVSEVKGQGLSLSTKILIGVGIGLGVLIIIIAVGVANFDLGDGPVIGGL